MAFDTWTPPVAPRVNGTGLTYEQAVDRADMGDGYEQVSERGINSMRENWTLAWPGILESNADALETFFLSKGLATPFWYRVPGRATPKLYRFVSFDRPFVAGHLDGVYARIRQSFDIEEGT
jgi:phage-related protein